MRIIRLFLALLATLLRRRIVGVYALGSLAALLFLGSSLGLLFEEEMKPTNECKY